MERELRKAMLYNIIFGRQVTDRIVRRKTNDYFPQITCAADYGKLPKAL